MRYIIGLFVALGLIILLVILLLSGGKKPNVVQARSLADYSSTDAQASLTITGPINADSLHQSVNITVDNNDVTYEQIQGYQNDVVNTQVFNNNQDAYNAFLRALDYAGFTSGKNDPSLSDSGIGYCATGDVYTFQLTQDGKTLENYWNTSCNHTKTYLGNTPLTLTLFQAQVPNYGQLTQNLPL